MMKKIKDRTQIKKTWKMRFSCVRLMRRFGSDITKKEALWVLSDFEPYDTGFTWLSFRRYRRFAEIKWGENLERLPF